MPPSKEFQEEAARRLFKRLNPEADPGDIDFSAHIDETLSLEENIDKLEKAYPMYVWRGEPREENPLIQEFRSLVEAGREGGLTDRQIVNALKGSGLSLEKPTSEGLAKANRRIADLLEEVKRLREERVKGVEAAAPTPVVPTTPPAPVRPKPAFTPEQEELLYNAFSKIISTKFRRNLFASETTQFEELLSSLNKVKPSLSFSQAQKQVEALARSIAAIGIPGRIIIRRGQQRIADLLDKMLSTPLTREEDIELRNLQAGVEPFVEEEIIYPAPRFHVIADSGPLKVPFPFDMGGYWAREAAEAEAERLTGRGFTVSVREE